MTRVVSLVMLIVTALAAPLVAAAQPPEKPARLGILYGASPAFAPETDYFDRGIVVGLRDHGYVVGQNLLIEFRSALGKVNPDPFPGLAAELVGLGVDVIVTTTEPGVIAARAASSTIPIVMATASTDPVASGLVASLARPGGNITGVNRADLAGKRLELLKETVPGLRSVAAFHGDPAVPIAAQWLRATEAAARRLGLALQPFRVPQDLSQWGPLFDTVNQRRLGAVTIQDAPRFETNGQLLASLALKHRLPMVFTFRSQAHAGGFMAYMADEEEIARRVGGITARILKGAKPAELPVEQPTKFELVINLKTAKALGLTIPPVVLARADEVIQ
jgi:putative tryptophan/tyrosine transport system substrate-binding protein